MYFFFVIYTKNLKQEYNFKTPGSLYYFLKYVCQKTLITSKIKANQTNIHSQNQSNLPHVEQKYIEALSRLSQLAQGGFSALESSISCCIKPSTGGREDPSFSTVCCLDVKIFN
jgi:hypothetical protein